MTLRWNAPVLALATAAALIAVSPAQAQPKPIELLVRQGERYRTARIDYRGGLRAPHLVRDAGKPDLLGDILSARK